MPSSVRTWEMSASGLVGLWSKKADTRLGFGQWAGSDSGAGSDRLASPRPASDQAIDAGIEAGRR